MNKVEAPLSNKTIENIFILMLIGIIICFIFPIVEHTIYKAQLSGVESSVYGNISSVELLYMKAYNDNEQISLPFTIEYKGDSYIAYVAGKEYNMKESLNIKGQQPISGQITINQSGEVSVSSLKYKNFTCNKAANDKVNCTRNS